VSSALRLKEAGKAIREAVELSMGSAASVTNIMSWLDNITLTLPVADAWKQLIKPATVDIYFVSWQHVKGYSKRTIKSTLVELAELWDAACKLGEGQEEKLDQIFLGMVLDKVIMTHQIMA
jgi:hypothetical protein